jgi:hypothetical protein
MGGALEVRRPEQGADIARIQKDEVITFETRRARPC